MKDQLIFDASTTGSITDSDSVGAYVRSGDSGALVTHHSLTKPSAGTFDFVDGDVTVGTDSIAETAHGFNTGDLVQLTSSGTLPAGLALATDYYVIRVDADNVKLAASAKDAEEGTAVDITAAAGGGTHTVTGQEQDVRALDTWLTNPSIEVTAVDLDIRDLTQTDEITVYQGTDPWIIGDGGGSITVDAVDLDIRDLTAASDSVESWTHDGTGTAITSTVNGGDTGLDVNLINASDIQVAINSEYAEDSAHVTADIGNFQLSIRMADVDGGNSALLAGTEGDYQGFFTSDKGELHTRDNDSVDLLTTIDADTSLIALATHLEDVAHVSGDRGMAIWGVRNDAETPLAADGDYIPFMMDAEGALITVSPMQDDALADTAIANASNVLDSADTPEDVVASPLASRKYLWIYNLDNQKAFIGASGVSAADGFPISGGAYVELRVGASVDIEFVGSAGKTPEIRTLELS